MGLSIEVPHPPAKEWAWDPAQPVRGSISSKGPTAITMTGADWPRESGGREYQAEETGPPQPHHTPAASSHLSAPSLFVPV